jgi:hypothetical protein
MNGDRWKFSLLGIFVLLILGQTSFYLLKLRQCHDPNKASPPVCDRLLEGYQASTDAHLQTVLALMVGSGAIAAGAAAVTSSRKPPDDPPEPRDP